MIQRGLQRALVRSRPFARTASRFNSTTNPPPASNPVYASGTSTSNSDHQESTTSDHDSPSTQSHTEPQAQPQAPPTPPYTQHPASPSPHSSAQPPVQSQSPLSSISPILSELQDTSTLAPEKLKLHERDILVINPYELENDKIRKLHEQYAVAPSGAAGAAAAAASQSSSSLLLSSYLLKKEDADPTAYLHESIDAMNTHSRGGSTEAGAAATGYISKNEHKALLQKLSTSFTKKQLTGYISARSTGSGSTPGFSKKNKRQISDYIIASIWNLKTSDNKPDYANLREKKVIKLARPEIHLLLSKNGELIRTLMSFGVKVTLPNEDSIQFVGTAEQLQAAELVLYNRLERAHRETVDLALLRSLYEEKHGVFDYERVAKATEVYFQPVAGGAEAGTYELIAVTREQIRRAKRLLVWLLDYNTHLRERHMVVEQQQPAQPAPEDLVAQHADVAQFFPYRDPESLSWISRGKSLYSLKSDASASRGAPANRHIQRELARFSDDRLSAAIPEFRRSIDEAKAIPTSFSDAGSGGSSAFALDDSTRALLRDLGLHDDDLQRPAEARQRAGEPPFGGASVNSSESDAALDDDAAAADAAAAPVGLSAGQKAAIHQHLTDFSYRDALHGVDASRLNEPVFTTTLGTVLFDGTDRAGSFYGFNSNIAFVNEYFLNQGVFNSAGGAGGASPATLHASDPHEYTIGLKFLPMVYEADRAATAYPPVEFQIRLNEHNTADLESSHMVTVEAENNYYVAMPGSKADVKVSSHITGNLLRDEEAAEHSDQDGVAGAAAAPEDDPLALQTLLNATSAKFSRFADQPGIKHFFDTARLDFSGLKKTYIPPYIDIAVNGAPVRYQHVTTHHKRTLTTELDGRTVEFNVVEGGSYGGRKVEINIIGNTDGDVGEHALASLVDFTTALAAKL